MLDVELYVFYHSISAAVNEFYNIILSVAEVVIGSEGAAIVFGIVNRNNVSGHQRSRCSRQYLNSIAFAVLPAPMIVSNSKEP